MPPKKPTPQKPATAKAAAPVAAPAVLSQAPDPRPQTPALPPAPEGHVNVFVDGTLLQVKKGTTVMAAARQAGKEIPHFCYHERLSIAGNCRMCLLEIEGMAKPVASCHWPVAEGNKIRTDSKMTIEARKGTMELLLINHPLDCPICDQGGECDLQDQAVAYGADRSHYHEFKRAVDDKDIGGKIKTVMTRCIHCTRCIRFATEVAGVEEFGATGRGENMQVGTYVEAALQSELAGNMIDLCPVGALTSKPYAFAGRPWELTDTPAIDILDGLGANLTVQSRAGQVMRILPRENDSINEEWITDAARFSYDALHTNRLTVPTHSRHPGEGRDTRPLSWPEAFAAIQKAVGHTPPARVAGLLGNLQSAEDAYAMKAFFEHTLGSKNYASAPAGWEVADANLLRGHTPYKQWEQADAVLLVGANPRLESPLLNARLLKLSKKRVPIALLGEPCELMYKVERLGSDVAALSDASAAFAQQIAAAKRPLIVIGAAVWGTSAHTLLPALWHLAQRPEWNGYNYLTPTGGTLAPLLLGFGAHAGTAQLIDKMNKNSVDVLFIHGDRDDVTPQMLRKFKGLSIYLGTHATPLAQACTLQLPAAAWSEKTSQYINMQGNLQVSHQATTPPGAARDDWKIYRALSQILKKTLPFDTLAQLRAQMPPLEFGKNPPKSAKLPKSAAPLRAVGLEYYLQNSYLRNSPTMHTLQAEQGSAQPAPNPQNPAGMGPRTPPVSNRPNLKNSRNAA